LLLNSILRFWSALNWENAQNTLNLSLDCQRQVVLYADAHECVNVYYSVFFLLALYWIFEVGLLNFHESVCLSVILRSAFIDTTIYAAIDEIQCGLISARCNLFVSLILIYSFFLFG
jgi:hypothetical protein